MTSIRQDLWLGDLIGKPAYRIVGEPLNVAAADLPEGEAFIDARVDLADVEGLSHLQNLGFSVVDCSVILERPMKMKPLGPEVDYRLNNIRFARTEDEFGVRALAREVFEFDRFHRDPRISDDVANRIKEEWAGNFFRGTRGTWMIIARDDQGVTGFVQLLSAEHETLVIDLVGVARRCRRQGVANSILEFGIRNLMENLRRIRVGTQLSNRPSMELYDALGFRFCSADYVLHRHNGHR